MPDYSGLWLAMTIACAYIFGVVLFGTLSGFLMGMWVPGAQRWICAGIGFLTAVGSLGLDVGFMWLLLDVEWRFIEEMPFQARWWIMLGIETAGAFAPLAYVPLFGLVRTRLTTARR